jgi:MOSC domain-containing protein YiiM
MLSSQVVVRCVDGGLLVSVNVGTPREIEWLGRRETTSIWKSPVEGSVRVAGVNVAGDDQADRSVHGGPDKAVYAYAREDQEWWERELARPLGPGTFGENLTLRGVDVNGALLGERWRIGTVLLEACQPRIPCWKIGARMGDTGFPVRFAEAGRPGAYLRIVEEGELSAGDPVEIVHRPAHGVTIGDVERIYHVDRVRVGVLLDVAELADGWRRWARKRLAASA